MVAVPTKAAHIIMLTALDIFQPQHFEFAQKPLRANLSQVPVVQWKIP